MKLRMEKIPVSVTLDQWVTDILDHICATSEINRSQLVQRAVKDYCLKRIVRANPDLWKAIYCVLEKESNDEHKK